MPCFPPRITDFHILIPTAKRRERVVRPVAEILPDCFLLQEAPCQLGHLFEVERGTPPIALSFRKL